MTEAGDAAQPQVEMNVAIVGQTDVGKSMVLKALSRRRPLVYDRSNTTGRGTTKSVISYDGGVLGNRKLVLWDTPGIGDADVTLQELIVLLEKLLRAPASIECQF